MACTGRYRDGDRGVVMPEENGGGSTPTREAKSKNYWTDFG